MPDLLLVEAAIERRLSTGSVSNPAWLHAKGRALLVRGQPADAIPYFQNASDLGLNDPDFWIDFASAYCARADREQMSIDYSRSIELVSRALLMRADDSVAHYNRAWLYWRLHLYAPAIVEMRRSAELEPDSQWREDALRIAQSWQPRLDSVVSAAPVAASSEANLDRSWRQTSWVPNREALAREMLEEQDDRWLTDLNTQWMPAELEQALWRSAESRTRLDVEAGDKQASTLVKFSRPGVPPALRVWAQFELLFLTSHSVSVAACHEHAKFIDDAIGRHYYWFAAQALLERSTCESALGDLDAADRSTTASIELAQRVGLTWTLTRATGFQLSHWTNEGRYREVMQTATETIENIFVKRLPPRVTHQPFLDMSVTAAALKRWNTAAAAAEMAAIAARTAKFKVPEIFALSRRVSYLRRAGETSAVIASATAEAEQVLRGLGSDPSAALVASLARVDITTDLKEIRGLEKKIESNQNLFYELPYRLARTGAELRAGYLQEAWRQALRTLDRIRLSGEDARKFRSEQERAARLAVQAGLEMGRQREALHLWQQFLLSDWRLLGSPSPQGAAEGDPPVTEITLTIADLEDGLASWLEFPNGEPRFRLVIRKDSERCLTLLRRLQRFASDPQTNRDEIDGLAASVRAILLGDWLNLVPSGRLLRVRARGELGSMPLMLVFPTALAEFAPMPLAPAACPVKRGSAVAIQATEIGPDWRHILPPLPNLGNETQASLANFERLERLSGRNATPSAIDAAMHGVDLVHFAGHSIRWKNRVHLVAFPDPNERTAERRRGLWTFSPDTKSCVNLLFLAACSTAAYEEVESVLPGQLAEAALASGVRSVVGTAWDVDTTAASRFAATFYKELASGRTPSSAMAAAAVELRSHAEFAHPYYWASFVIFSR